MTRVCLMCVALLVLATSNATGQRSPVRPTVNPIDPCCSDGGTTWTRSVTQRLWPSVHGVDEGKIIVAIGASGGIANSFNGGRNFTSRPFALPAPALGLTFPDAQHGYLVGQHGMVFRYRIVPIDYSSPGMIGAMA